jgi:hypothetical protein
MRAPNSTSIVKVMTALCGRVCLVTRKAFFI